jgi:hypothetical protein
MREQEIKTEAMHVPATLNQEPIPERTILELRGGAHIHIHFTTKFQYLGSKITSKLSDNLDVNTHISIANSQIGQLKELFRCNAISIRTNKFPYGAIPLSTLLWGCETCALKEEENIILDLLHHGAIRRVLGVSRQKVRDERITNSAVRNKFLNMPTMMNLVKRRLLKYIGKVAREDKERSLYKSFITPYLQSPMHVGGQHKSHRDLSIECVRTILPDTPTSAPFKRWIYEAQYEIKLNALISNFWEWNHLMRKMVKMKMMITILNQKQKYPPHRK